MKMRKKKPLVLICKLDKTEISVSSVSDFRINLRHMRMYVYFLKLNNFRCYKPPPPPEKKKEIVPVFL